MATTLNTTFKLKRATAARWIEVNPILAQGEPGFEYDTFRLKVGDGIISWVELPYVNEEFFLSPDSNSIAINVNGDLTIYGFNEAVANQIPIKSEDGKITWMTLSPVASSGLIEDLNQNEPIVLYGGSASDLVGV